MDKLIYIMPAGMINAKPKVAKVSEERSNYLVLENGDHINKHSPYIREATSQEIENLYHG
ncbi:hypothetical protein SAMN05421743_12156 [Thalassobacillus cyri]|uniref:Uncharacterized protein n=1 Tax=Thalassobacillus cyri TaxID=571932 RepID=A0A1H4H3C9_9BACI|nr:hypothetical protein [Thalassobacillus cyri]SEB15870.1 hypothetical protein SAMN05421743_12156 [Thalassobacillus cyri]